jgi:hypothetical protein
VLILKGGHRICGSGSALANNPITQSKAYFEVKVQQNGLWSVGLCTREANLNCIPFAVNQPTLLFCVITSDGQIVLNGQSVHQLSVKIQESDTIGIAYDHVELRFYVNNQLIDYCVTGLKGEFYPVLTVDSGAILDASFASFQHDPPIGFDRILIEKSLL